MTEQPQHKGLQEQQYDENYEQIETFENKVPLQVVVSLKKEQNLNNLQSYEQITVNPEILSKNNLEKVKAQLKQKIQLIEETKKNITIQKKTIKDIGAHIDREMDRTLFRQNRTVTTVSIKDIFKQTSYSSGKLKNLQDELNFIRKQIHKQKEQNIKFQRSIGDPINSSNIFRAIQLDEKMKEKESQLKQLKKQKDIYNEQIQRTKIDVPFQYEQNMLEECKKIKQELNMILTKVKQERIKLYEIQRIDCILTEKAMFIKQIMEQNEHKKMQRQEISESQKLLMQNQIKNISNEIRQLMEEKFKTQNQKTNQLKNLTSEVSTLQKKNWETIQLLREIDSFLLKYYSAKLKDPRHSIRKKQKQRVQRSAIYSLKSHQNDKQSILNESHMDMFPADPVMVQKKKNVQVGISNLSDQNNQNILLSDDFIGPRQKLQKITFRVDEEKIYGVQATYTNQFKCLLLGLNMLSRIKPKDVKQICLTLKPQQYLTNMNVGLSKSDKICYFKLSTSENNSLEWGSKKENTNIQEKSLKKYQSIVLKSKLIQIGPNFGPNCYCLGGLGFSIIYLGPK